MTSWFGRSSSSSPPQEYDLVGRDIDGGETFGIEMPKIPSSEVTTVENEEEESSSSQPMTKMEIETFSSEFEESSEQNVHFLLRRRCRRFLCLLCEFTALILLIVVLTAAYIGGLIPRWHLPQKKCPELSSHNRLKSVLDLNLNRQARLLRSNELEKLNGAQVGFGWNHGDNATQKWRPQGITTLNVPWKHDEENTNDEFVKFVLVSWYGRIDKKYYNRGARISFVRLENSTTTTAFHESNSTVEKTPMDSKTGPSYRHVLLVDKHLSPIPFLHAGGLAIDHQTNKLHVPDSRYPWNYHVRVFDIATSLYQVPSCHSERFFGYGYVLKQHSSYRVPVIPSFMSFVEPRQMLVGSYAHTCEEMSRHTDLEECRLNKENQLAWVELGKPHTPSPVVCAPFYSEMQGAAFAKDLYENNTTTTGRNVLWISSSYGGKKESHLHTVVDFDPQANCNHGQLESGDIEAFNTTTFIFPPGMEDLCIDKSARSLWSLTEFGSRIVFAVPFENLLSIEGR